MGYYEKNHAMAAQKNLICNDSGQSLCIDPVSLLKCCMSSQQRLVIIVSILASFVAFLDASVVYVALPSIVQELGGGLAAQQWVADAYLITLGSLILLAGSLSDLFGQKKILIVGLAGFALASALCAVAPTIEFLISARALQGIAGALLVPSSLGLIISSFSGAAQGKAIGSWTAWTGIAFVIGPLVGGFLVDWVSWRLVFAINLPIIALTLWIARLLQRDADNTRKASIDFSGAMLCSIGLGGLVYALIEQPHSSWSSPLILGTLFGGLVLLAIFVWWENRVAQPMLSLELFKVRNFTFGNVATFAIYGGLSGASFLIVVFVQQFGGYSALEAGLCLMPVTLFLFVLSPPFGKLSHTYGPRLFMTFGPIIAGVAFLMMMGVDQPLNYWSQLLPGVLLFGVGLSITVAPLTSAVLGAIDSQHAGIGSAINNAVARIAGLITIAAVGLIVGADELTPAAFRRGILAMAVLMVAGGIISAVGIRNLPGKVNVEPL